VNGSQILASLGWVKVYACTDTERAIAHFERSIRLSPRDPEMASTLTGIRLEAWTMLGAQSHIADPPIKSCLRAIMVKSPDHRHDNAVSCSLTLRF
jgi:hypothetical protein